MGRTYGSGRGREIEGMVKPMIDRILFAIGYFLLACICIVIGCAVMAVVFGDLAKTGF